MSDPTPRHEVTAFAQLMEQKLRENDHKPGWKQDHPEDLLNRLYEEADEIRRSWDHWRGTAWPRETLAPIIGGECADVANFAMMIADVCGSLSSEAPPVSPSEASAGNLPQDEPNYKALYTELKGERDKALRALAGMEMMRDVYRDIAIKLGACPKCAGLHGPGPCAPSNPSAPPPHKMMG